MGNIIEFNSYKRERRSAYMCEVLKRIQGKKAEEILKENNISLDPPINLDALMKELGIFVREHDFSFVEKTTGFATNSILGATILMGDKVMILHKKYAEKRNDHGKRFTIAHELGHCVLHAEELKGNHLQLRSDICDKNNVEEVAANTFAGELLIPDKSLEDICRRLIIPSLSTLAEIFDVSTSVMKERLKESKIKYLDDVVS